MIKAINNQEKYSKQILFNKLGKIGQERLNKSSAVIIGCGARGSAIATCLVRAGFGKIKLIDRSVTNFDDISSQILFDEDDINRCLPKAQSAAKHLQKINSQVDIHFEMVNINYKNIQEQVSGYKMIIDGTNSMETRFLLNDYSVSTGIPWIFGGASGAMGMVLTVNPRFGPCIRCFLSELPAEESIGNVSNMGLLNTTAITVACMQATEVIKYFGTRNQNSGELLWFDLWNNEFRKLKIRKSSKCPVCAEKKFEFLSGQIQTVSLSTGEDKTYQIYPDNDQKINFDQVISGIRNQATNLSFNDSLLSFKVGSAEIALFSDARVIIKGVDNEKEAMRLYSKIINNGFLDNSAD